MILRTVELKHFGRFSEKSFEFRRGMNIVTGPNEAGKSTLMESVPAVLFGVRNKDRFRPWGRQGSCEAALVLEEGGHTVRVERDLLTDRVSLAERDDLYQLQYQFEGKVPPLGRSSDRLEYLEQIGRLFGLAEEDLFRASLFFGQGSLELAGEAGLAAKVKTLLSGFVEVDYDRVLQSLNDDYFSITRVNPWGKDKTRERELDEVRRRIGELEQRWLEAQDAIRQMEELRKRIAELEAGIERDRGDFEKGERYLAWVRRQWQMEEKEESLRREFTRVDRRNSQVVELEQERDNLRKELEKTGLPREIPEDLSLLLAEAEDVRKEMVGLQAEAAEFREQLLKRKAVPWWPPAATTASLFLTAAGVGWMRPPTLVPSLMVAGLVAAILWILYVWRYGQERAERNRIKGQAQMVEKRREQFQGRMMGLDERFEGLGLSPSAVAIVKMQRNLERHRQLSERLREVESALGVLEKASELADEKHSLTRELAVLGERREKERPPREGLLSPEEIPEAEEKLKSLGEDIRTREKELIEWTRREAVLQGELADLHQIEEEGERLRDRESALARRKNALAAAYALLSESVTEFRQNYLERFATEIGHYLSAMTHGRYESVRLDDDFSLSLKGKTGSWQPSIHFSRGTLDGIYFAVRLGLTRHLSRGKRLPLLLDDPLVNMDRHRLGETVRLLERLSSEHQVILFTHDDRLLKRAARDRWHIVSLEEARIPIASHSQERSEDVGQLHLL